MLASLAGGGRLPHTVIISGGEGSGKKTFAAELAASYFCTSTLDRPCGVCLDCRLALSGTHPDLEYISSSSESKIGAINVELVRKVKMRSQIKPNQSDRRGFVLLNCQTMLAQAQNALLKQIEEPVKGVFYILVTENSHALLETIRSRAVSFNMSDLTTEQCAKVVCELMPNADCDYVQTAASLSGGSVGLTLEAIKSPANQIFYNDCQSVLDAITRQNLYDALVELSKYESNRQEYLAFLNSLKRMLLRNVRETGFALTPSQIVEISDILDYGVNTGIQNVVLSLLSTVIAGKIMAVKP